MNVDVILKRFDKPDEVRTFEKGRFELITLGGMTIGRATYQPGWKWSEHVGPGAGAAHCHVEHVGMVDLRPRDRGDGRWQRVIEMRAGRCLLHPAEPHMIHGSSAMSPTCRCISSARKRYADKKAS